MIRELTRLLALNLAIAAAALVVAWLTGGSESTIRCLIAFAVSVPLAVLCLGLALWSWGRGITWQLGSILGGSLARSGLTLLIGFAFYALLPVCKNWQFWMWVAAAYLITMVLEVVSLMGAIRQKTGGAALLAVAGGSNETTPR